MSRKTTGIKIDAGEKLPTIEEIVEQFAPKKEVTHEPSEKVAGQPKEPGDTSETVVDADRPGPASAGASMETGDGGESDVSEGEVEAPVEEAVEEPAPKVEPKKDFLSSRFAALSRKEKAARDAETEVARRRAELDQKAKEIEERALKFASAKSPLDVLKAHGFSYQDVTEAQLGMFKEPERDPSDVKFDERFKPIEESFNKIKEDNEQLKAKIEEYENERRDGHLKQFRTSIVETAKNEGHEFIIEAGDEAVDLVQNVISQYFQKYKKVLSFSEACATVELYYTDRITKLSNVPKMRSKFAAPSAPPATPPQKEVKSPNTLTQSLSQGTRATPNIDDLPKQEALEHLAKRLRYI